MTTDIPKCTSWLGHKFEARFSSEPSDVLTGFKVELRVIDIPMLLTKQTYECDICVRCGHKVMK